jgi:hypothetical protein
VLVGGDWSVSHPDHSNPGTHWIGGWVGPRASLDNVEKRKFLTPVIQPIANTAVRTSNLTYTCFFLKCVPSSDYLLIWIDLSRAARVMMHNMSNNSMEPGHSRKINSLSDGQEILC